MDISEFTLKLTKNFGREINEDTIKELKTWALEKNISEDFLDLLYMSIKVKHPYDKFPSYSLIMKQAGAVIIKKKEEENRKHLSNGRNTWKAEEFFKDADPWEILELLKKIDKKNVSGIKLESKEVNTRCTFGVMISDYYDMEEKEWSEKNIYNRIKFIQESICEGRDVVALWEMDQKSKKSPEAVSSLIDSFNDKKNIRDNPGYFNN